MGPINFDRLRMQNLFNKPQQGPSGTGYRLYDTFASKVLPDVIGARNSNRRYAEQQTQQERDYESQQRDQDRQFEAWRARTAENAARNQAANAPRQSMNVVIDRSQEISPYQKAVLDLRQQEIGQRGETAEGRLTLAEQQLEELKRKNLAGEDIKRETVEIQKFRAEFPNAKQIDQPNGDTIFVDPRTGREIKRFGPSGILGDKEKVETKAAADVQAEATRQAGREGLAEEKAWTVVNIEGKSYRYNPQLNKLEPIDAPGAISRPGVDTTAKDAAAAKEKADKLEAVRSRARDTMATIDAISATDAQGNLTLKPEMAENVGWSHYPSVVRNLFPTDSRKAQATATRLKKETILDLIGEMKAQSKTGATGFGALNLEELSVLEKSANQLDEAGSEEAYASELKRIRDKLQRILMDAPGTTSAPGPGAPAPKKPTAADLIKKYGGG